MLCADASAANQGEQAKASFANYTVNDKCNDSIQNENLPCDDLAYRYGRNDDSKQPRLPQPVVRKRLPILFQAVPEGNHAAHYPVIYLTDRRTRQYACNAKWFHQQKGNHDVDDGTADGDIPPFAKKTVCCEKRKTGILIDMNI